MPYIGGSLTSLFGAQAQAATRDAARAMCERGGDRMVDVTRENTPIGGRYEHGNAGGGNLRTSWYQLPVRPHRHILGPGWQSGVASDVHYAPYVEHGTGLWGPEHAKYLIEPKKPGGFLRWIDPQTGQEVFARRVWHPGSPGQHMIAIAGAVVEAEFDSGALVEDILARWVREVEGGAD